MRQPETSPECAPGVRFIAHCDRGCYRCSENTHTHKATFQMRNGGWVGCLFRGAGVSSGKLNPVGHRALARMYRGNKGHRSPATGHRWRWMGRIDTNEEKVQSSCEAEGSSDSRE